MDEEVEGRVESEEDDPESGSEEEFVNEDQVEEEDEEDEEFSDDDLPLDQLQHDEPMPEINENEAGEVDEPVAKDFWPERHQEIISLLSSDEE